MAAPLSVRDQYDAVSNLPLGRRLFSKVIGVRIPYSGTVHASVEELRVGYARTRMSDRRSVRNHLRSIHAAALMNFAELTSGLAFNYALPDDARAILTRFTIDYVKKARGTLTAECTCEPPRDACAKDYQITVDVFDGARERVATAVATWRVGQRKKT